MSPALFMAEGSVSSGFAFTSDMFSGLTQTISDNAGIIVPVGVGIFAIMLSIKFAPRIIKALARG